MAVTTMSLLTIIDALKVMLFNGTHDLDTHTFKKALFTSAWVTTTQLYSSTNELATANGYTQGGATLANSALSVVASNVRFDADDTVFTASGGDIGPARYEVIYNDTDASKTILGYRELDNTPADVTATDGNTLTTQENALGIFEVTF